MPHLLIVDDDIRVARALEDYLRRKSHRVTIAGNGSIALDVIAKERPDLVVLDVDLSGISGLEICRKIRSYPIQSSVPVIFLSARDTGADRITGFEAGGDDYVPKPFDMRELELRIQALLRRTGAFGGLLDSPEVRVGDLHLNKKTFRARVGKREVQLTPVEFELLQYLMLRAGEVVSSEQLLQEVWRYYPGTGDAAVVRVQIMNLRDKIERDRKRPAYIQTVYRHGYMIPTATSAMAS